MLRPGAALPTQMAHRLFPDNYQNMDVALELLVPVQSRRHAVTVTPHPFVRRITPNKQRWHAAVGAALLYTSLAPPCTHRQPHTVFIQAEADLFLQRPQRVPTRDCGARLAGAHHGPLNGLGVH